MMGKLLRWIVYKIGLLALLQATLLAVVIGSLVSTLSAISWRLKDANLGWIALLALTWGWLLGRSRFHDGQAFLWATVGGSLAAFISASQLVGPAIDLWFALNRWGTQAAQAIFSSAPLPDHLFLATRANSLVASITTALDTVGDWLQTLSQGQILYDQTSSTLVWDALVWAVATWAAWFVRRRRQPIAAVVPAISLQAASLSFTRNSPYFLLPAVLSTLLLVGWSHYGERIAYWRKQQIDTAEDLPFDMSLWSASVAIVISGSALFLSSFSPQATFAAARNFLITRSEMTQELGQSLGLEQKPATQRPLSGLSFREGAGVPELPRSHLLGAGPDLNQQLALRVRLVQPSGEPELPRLYWRAQTYDVYTGGGWANSALITKEYSAGEPVHRMFNPWYVTIVVQVQPLHRQDRQIFFAGDLQSVNQPYQVNWRAAPASPVDTGDDTARFDFSSANLRQPARNGEFLVASQVAVIGEQQLRRAPGAYPAWVRERYLQIPSEVPTRVRNLALSLALNQPTPYDRAVAIQKHLRSYPYSLEVPAPPPGVEVSDYFLFNLRKGYCDYYATAMVVLSRLAGLPARLVTGYTSGILDKDGGYYLVMEANAHSWAEIYFSGIGWVEFEPTAGQMEIMHPLNALPTTDQPPVFPALPNENLQQTTPVFPHGVPGVLGWIIFVAGLGGLLVWITRLISAWCLKRQSPAETFLTLYRRLRRQGQALGLPLAPHNTPYEYALTFCGYLVQFTDQGQFSRYLAPAQVEINYLIENYVKSQYSLQQPGVEVQRECISQWQRLAPRLLVVRLIHHFSKLIVLGMIWRRLSASPRL